MGTVSHSDKIAPLFKTPSIYFSMSGAMVKRFPAKSDAAQGPKLKYSSPVQYFMLCRQM